MYKNYLWIRMSVRDILDILFPYYLNLYPVFLWGVRNKLFLSMHSLRLFILQSFFYPCYTKRS